MSAPNRLGSFRRTTWLALLASVGCMAAAAASAAQPAAASGDEIATLEAASGQVLVIRLGQSLEPPAPAPLLANDVVVTRRGRATVRFQSDGTVLRIGPDSRVEVNESAKGRDIQVFFGRVWAHVVRWRERPTRFLSAGTIAAMRGTELNIAVAGEETQLAVLEGRVQAENDAGSLLLTTGQVAVATKGSAPALRLQLKPKDAVRWALYYLPVLSVKPGAPAEGTAWQRQLRESSEAYAKGELKRAIESLEGVEAGDIRDPGFFTYRASLRLAAGNVDEAGQDIARALALSPNDSDALSLETIVAVVANQAEKALATARRAVGADPRSATAQIALSYAQQAKFDLEGARESLESAVKLAPGDALAWARLAEIRSSFGRLDQALEAAQKANELQPNLARTQTVLGFAHLTRVQIREATQAFKKAVELDPADPLPRLGLGLAMIRDGDLSGGSREIEVAVSLDPGESLVRSYLGKAYFEAKRTALVDREYEVAKESDPLDPTPWFYDALAKQTTNRPVEALDSLQKAISLNDNRAVYRSRLLLDSDLAARSASLGRLYADMGFQDLAVVQGWRSVHADPSDFSGHRLLADSYAALPRHEIGRVSELFQSQMLQPLNTTPIQPALGEGSLFLVAAQGPGALAFNEFNPLFNRDHLNAQGSFLGGGDDTWFGEGIVSGIYKKASFSAGYSGFETDGFRPNSSQNDRIGNAFAQFELSPSTSVQGEFRYRKLESGDRELRFDEDAFNPLLSQEQESKSVRVGARQNLGPAWTLLGSYMHQEKDGTLSVPDPLRLFDFGVERDEGADSVEGQALFRARSFKVVGGGGYFKVDALETVLADIFRPPLPFPILSTTTISDTKIAHTNLYAYGYAGLAKNFTLTFGVSGDLFDETGTATQTAATAGRPPRPATPVPAPVLGDRNQANPKLGLLWTAKSRTTLRAAAFRAVKRTLISDQTLEPTQVAGFNQFYDDPSATKSWVYGGAIDQTFSDRLFAGFEFARRDLEIPQTVLRGGTDLSIEERASTENLARAYFFLAPHRWLTFSAEYQYERIERERELFLGFTEVKTHRLPLSLRFFHPSGVSALVSTTYLDQSGDFIVTGSDKFAPGKRDFWIVDAGLRYRLPKRYGFIAAGVNNLTDERSTYQATDSRNLTIRPGRTAFVRVTLAFP